jgi:hypothetical protein
MPEETAAAAAASAAVMMAAPAMPAVVGPFAMKVSVHLFSTLFRYV